MQTDLQLSSQLSSQAQAAQSVALEFISTASESRGKAEARTMPALPAVMQQAEADSAVAMAEAT